MAPGQRADLPVPALNEGEANEDCCQEARLIDVQNCIIPAHSRDDDYRSSQVSVGQVVTRHDGRIHFVGPKPDDLPDLMDGLIAAHERMDASTMSAVAHAAAVSYGFVLLHPFGTETDESIGS